MPSLYACATVVMETGNQAERSLARPTTAGGLTASHDLQVLQSLMPLISGLTLSLPRQVLCNTLPVKQVSHSVTH